MVATFETVIKWQRHVSKFLSTLVNFLTLKHFLLHRKNVFALLRSYIIAREHFFQTHLFMYLFIYLFYIEK